MSITLPPELQAAVADRAARLQVTPDELVGNALRWYLQIDPELLDELVAWQEVRDEALASIEADL